MDQKDICKISLEYTFISSTHWLLSRMMPWLIKPILTDFRKLGSLQVWFPTIIELNKKSISKKKKNKVSYKCMERKQHTLEQPQS